LNCIQNTKKIVFESPFGDLEVTYAFHLELVGKTVVDFLFVVIERFHCLFSWNVISGNLSKSAFVEGVAHFERKFQTEGGVVHQPLLVSEKYCISSKSHHPLQSYDAIAILKMVAVGHVGFTVW